jgi:hypothetical protein
VCCAEHIPDMVRNTFKDHMAVNGITEDDVEEMARTALALPTKQ